MTLDQWRARYEELDAEAARLRVERDAARTLAAELEMLFDLQRKRMDAARALWQDAHPEKENVWPDLGDLLEWLMQERDAARAEAALAVEALRKLSEQVAISAKDSFGTCEEWLDSFRLEAPDECAAYEEAVAVLSSSDPALDWLAQVKREAAAEELLGLKDSIRGGTRHPHVAWRCISTRAAVLRATKEKE